MLRNTVVIWKCFLLVIKVPYGYITIVILRFEYSNDNILSLDGCESLLPNIDGTSQIAYYYNGGHWNYICGNGVTNDVADVICRETGNTTARAYRSVALSFGPLTYPIYGSRFQCNGTESSLCDCESISETCSAMEIVEVQCDLPGKEFSQFFLTKTTFVF